MCSILVIDVHNFDQAFLKHKSLFLRLYTRVIQAITLLLETLAPSVSTDCDSATIIGLALILRIFTCGFAHAHRVLRRYSARLLFFDTQACNCLQLCL